jgi:glycine/D-amino acid oxidase-like deaminating enzyme
LSNYFRYLKDVRRFNKWAGHYYLNTIDGTPYIFEDSGLIVADGTSDAIGRTVAVAQAGRDITTLYGGKVFSVAKLGICRLLREN